METSCLRSILKIFIYIPQICTELRIPISDNNDGKMVTYSTQISARHFKS